MFQVYRKKCSRIKTLVNLFLTQDQYFMTEITFVRVVFRQYIIIIDKNICRKRVLQFQESNVPLTIPNNDTCNTDTMVNEK